jgi:hypothetical protein
MQMPSVASAASRFENSVTECETPGTAVRVQYPSVRGNREQLYGGEVSITRVFNSDRPFVPL